jgi:hypothetical protein
MSMEYGYIWTNDVINNDGRDMYKLAKSGDLVSVDIALSNGETIRTHLLPVDYYSLKNTVKYQSVKVVEYVHYIDQRESEGDRITSLQEESYTIPLSHIVYIRD